MSPLSTTTIRRLLWGVAVVCLGVWLWYQLDGALFRAVEGRRLDRALASGGPAPAVDAPTAADGTAARADREQPAATSPASLPPDEPAAAAEPAPAADTHVLGRLEIPRLDLSVLVAEGVDARTLRRAAGHVPGTAAPGSPGNVAIAGHRDGVFRRLEDAARDDLVVLETPGGRARYRIKGIDVVTPDATEVLAPTERSTLTLITCYPFNWMGPAPERFVVRAELLGPEG